MICFRLSLFCALVAGILSGYPHQVSAQSVDAVLPGIAANEIHVPPVPATSMDVYPPERRPYLDGAPDETAMWNAINAGQDSVFEELVLRAKRLYPGWKVPHSMTEARESHARQGQVRAAISSGDDWRIIDAASRWPSYFNCNHEGNVWALYDAQRRVGAVDEVRALINRTVRRCHSSMRLTAIQKANENFGPKDAIEWSKAPGAKGNAEQEFVAQISRAGSGRALDAYGVAVRRIAESTNSVAPGSEIPKDMYVIQDIAGKRKDPNGALVAGWWLINSGRAAAAESAFRSAAEWGGGDKAYAGLIYALLAQDKRDEADALAARWPNAVPDYSGIRNGGAGAKVYEAQKAGDFVSCVIEAQKPEVSDYPQIQIAKGWCLMELDKTQQALSAFEAAQRNSNDGKTTSEAIDGRIAAASKLGMNAYLAQLAQDESLAPEERKNISRSLAIGAFVRAYEAGEYGSAIDAADTFRKAGGELDDRQKLLYGWALHNGGKCSEARDFFKVLAERLPVGEAKIEARAAAKETARSMPYNNPFGCIDRTGTPPSAPVADADAEERIQFDWL